MTPATTKRRPTIVSAYAYAHERQRADKLFQACAERDKIIAAQRQQIRDLIQQVRNARASLARMKRRDAADAEAQAKECRP